MAGDNSHPSIFHALADLFAQMGLEAVLAGGFAVNAHKFSRQTNDVDFVVRGRDSERIHAKLTAAGFTALVRNQTFARYRAAPQSERIVDFLFVDDASFAGMATDSETLSIARKPFRVLSLKHLIAMKLHALRFGDQGRGAKDLVDILELARANALDTEGPEFRDWCLKYGTADVYERIRALARQGDGT